MGYKSPRIDKCRFRYEPKWFTRKKEKKKRKENRKEACILLGEFWRVLPCHQFSRYFFVDRYFPDPYIHFWIYMLNVNSSCLTPHTRSFTCCRYVRSRKKTLSFFFLFHTLSLSLILSLYLFTCKCSWNLPRIRSSLHVSDG